MLSRLPIAGLSALVLLAACAETGQEPLATSAADAGPAGTPGVANGLGVSQAQIIAALGARGLDPNAFEAQTLQDGRQVMAASYPASTQRQVLWVAIFGPSETPHTVRVDYFPANARVGEAEVVDQALDELMTTLFPDWPDGSRWPEVAGGRAWQEAAKLSEEDLAAGRLPVLGTSWDGAWLGALGFPPQLVSYVLTTRDACRPFRVKDYMQGDSACR